MKKKMLFVIIAGFAALSQACDISSAQTTQQPTFEASINLFNDRNLAEEIEKKYPGKIPAEVLAWLATPEAHEQLCEAAGRQLPQIGHDNQRKELYSGNTINPSFIALTFSGKETLEETIQSLKKARLAHNFFVDRDGKIYPVTKQGETVEQALQHRPFAVGASAQVIDGTREQRDMNAASISISVIGKDTEPTTPQQNISLINLTAWLQKTYNIRADQVVDYGCVGYPYSRRNPQPNLPWELLTNSGLATYPKQEHIEQTDISRLPKNKILWVCLALRKIGFICPITKNDQNQDFKASLVSFQQHCKCAQQDSTITVETIGALNSMIIQHEAHNPKLKEIVPPALQINNTTSNDKTSQQ